MLGLFRTAALSLVVATLAVHASLSGERPAHLDKRQIPTFTSWTPPTRDPFYRVPADVAKYAPGDIIDQRPVFVNTKVLFTKGAWQLKYRSQTALGDPDATIATVFQPRFPSNPPKIVVAGFFQDAVANDCAPSWTLVSGSISAAQITSYAQTINIDNFLQRGYYVVAPDFQGSQSAFQVGVQAGRATLDSIRAFINHRPSLPNPANNQVILTGYSGGSHAVAWALHEYSEGYASELNIIGAAHGGLPVDPQTLLLQLNKGPNAGFAAAGIAGMRRAYPDFKAYIDANNGPSGNQLMAAMNDGRNCVLQIALGFGGRDIYQDFKESQNVSFANPIVAARLAQNTLFGKTAVKVPQVIYQSTGDIITNTPNVKTYVKEQCDKGSIIELQLPGGVDHVTQGFLTIGPSIGWIDGRFAGRIKPTACSGAAGQV